MKENAKLPRTGTSPSNCLVLYPGQLLEEGTYTTAEMQSVYCTAPDDWAIYIHSIHTRKYPERYAPSIELRIFSMKERDYPHMSIKQTYGSRGVMVIVVRNGHGDTSSNPGRG